MEANKKKDSSSLPSSPKAPPRLAGISSSSSSVDISSTNLKIFSRLPSFKAPRDLTLSSLGSSSSLQLPVARTKKTFLPNIPQRRDKVEKIAESKSEKPQKKSASRSKERGRGRGGREKVFVQSKGALFGDGIAAGPARRSTSFTRGQGGRGSGSSSASDIQKPVLDLNAAYNIDKDVEEKRLKELMRDDFLDDPDDVTLPSQCPIVLPMGDRGSQTPHLPIVKKKDDNESTTIIKEEPVDFTDDNTIKNTECNLTTTTTNLGRTDLNSLSSILTKSEDSDFMFFQLPSCLPGHPPENETLPSQSSDDNQAKPQLCSLSTLPEGRIGTLRVYGSGKVELCLGENHVLQVDQGTDVSFLQRVMRIQTDAEAQTGSMVALGHITNRFVCSPNFEALSLYDKIKNS